MSCLAAVLKYNFISLATVAYPEMQSHHVILLRRQVAAVLKYHFTGDTSDINREMKSNRVILPRSRVEV